MYDRQGSVDTSLPVNVTFNETVVLQCNYDGIESGMIHWFKNGGTIDFTVSI